MSHTFRDPDAQALVTAVAAAVAAKKKAGKLPILRIEAETGVPGATIQRLLAIEAGAK